MKVLFVFLVTILAVVFSSGCKAKNSTIGANYTLTCKTLDSIIYASDTCIILFWTTWCSGSDRISGLYEDVQKIIKQQNRNINLVLIGSDSNVSDSIILAQRRKGFLSYTLNSPTSNAWLNRKQIKRFIYDCFDLQADLQEVRGNFYPVPVELLISSNKEIIDADTPGRSLAFLYDILKSSTE